MSEGWDQNAQLSVNPMGWANEEQPQTSQWSQGVTELLLTTCFKTFY